MIEKNKLVRVTRGQENQGVSQQQKKNAQEAGLELAETLGINTPIEELKTMPSKKSKN